MFKKWAVSSVRDLLRKIDTTNLISRKAGSRRPRTVRTEQNIKRVAELICSQEDNPGCSWQEYPAVLCDESLREICSFRSSDARRHTCCSILIIDQWSSRLKAVVQVHGGHIEQLFTWLSACCTVLLLRYRHTHELLLFSHCDIMMLGCFDSVVIFFEQPVDILILFGLQYTCMYVMVWRKHVTTR